MFRNAHDNARQHEDPPHHVGQASGGLRTRARTADAFRPETHAPARCGRRRVYRVVSSRRAGRRRGHRDYSRLFQADISPSSAVLTQPKSFSSRSSNPGTRVRYPEAPASSSSAARRVISTAPRPPQLPLRARGPTCSPRRPHRSVGSIFDTSILSVDHPWHICQAGMVPHTPALGKRSTSAGNAGQGTRPPPPGR